MGPVSILTEGDTVYTMGRKGEKAGDLRAWTVQADGTLAEKNVLAALHDDYED